MRQTAIPTSFREARDIFCLRLSCAKQKSQPLGTKDNTKLAAQIDASM
jgi:hypothetical protein